MTQSTFDQLLHDTEPLPIPIHVDDCGVDSQAPTLRCPGAQPAPGFGTPPTSCLVHWAILLVCVVTAGILLALGAP